MKNASGVILLVASGLLAACAGSRQQCPREPALSQCAGGDCTRPQRPARELKRPTPLSDALRETVRRRMMHHGDEMENLFWSVLTLDYEYAQLVALQMIQDPPDPELTDRLPREFIDLHDAMFQSAEAVASAASAADAGRLGTAFSQLSGTCVRCHDLYMKMPADGHPPP